MLSHTTWLVSKMDSLKYIFEKPALTGRIARWQVLLSEYDIVYVTLKAIKGIALANYLAQQPLNDYQPMHPEFPDEDIMALFGEKVEDKDKDKWIVWFNGASKEGEKWNIEVCLIRLSFIKVTTSVTHASFYRLGSFPENLS